MDSDPIEHPAIPPESAANAYTDPLLRDPQAKWDLIRLQIMAQVSLLSVKELEELTQWLKDRGF